MIRIMSMIKRIFKEIHLIMYDVSKGCWNIVPNMC